jgi:hypothetical protein
MTAAASARVGLVDEERSIGRGADNEAKHLITLPRASFSATC